MNVDTDSFRALTGQAEELAALGRKISTLTGHVDRLSGLVEDQLQPLILVADHLIGDTRAALPREAAGHVTPKRDRHLRVIQGGGR